MTTVQFTKEQLFADLSKDGITLDANKIKKAKNGDDNVMWSIAYKYQYEKQQYDKAMAWYRLAAVKNNHAAQNNIGALYDQGLGVPKDYLVALEWYLKAAIQNERYAWSNIGIHFENGRGVPVNKYKALEWYTKCGREPDSVVQNYDALINQGIRLTQQDKNKSIEQLIIETVDIVWEARKKSENKLKEEIGTFKQRMNKMEEDSKAKDSKMKSLQEEVKTFRAIAEDKQQEINTHLESIDQYKRKEQALNSELQALKQANHTVTLKMEAKDNKVTALEKEIKLLQIISENSSQGANKRVEELEKSIQTFEQERQLKDGQIKLLKQKMEFVSETEKQKRRNLEKENRSMKRELKSMKASTEKTTSHGSNATKNDSDTSDSNNDTDYDTEQDNTVSDNNDINYDTPGDDGEDNNDLNYDSDEQIKNKSEVALTQITGSSRNANINDS